MITRYLEFGAPFFSFLLSLLLFASATESSFLVNERMFGSFLGTSALSRSSSAFCVGTTGSTRALGARRVATPQSVLVHHNNIVANPRPCSTRLFGTKRGVSGNPLGTIAIYNDQVALKTIDEKALEQTVQRISKILGYETYDVTLLLVDDEEMRETNLESRGIDAPTDILSFPFLEAHEPGLLEEPEFDIPDYYTLGDLVVDVPYVMRRCQEDSEGDVEDDEDRGVSGAMATESDPEKRINMLLIHGMLHLVGYDHEEDDEYEEMVEREEEILKELGYTI